MHVRSTAFARKNSKYPNHNKNRTENNLKRYTLHVIFLNETIPNKTNELPRNLLKFALTHLLAYNDTYSSYVGLLTKKTKISKTKIAK